MGTALFPEPTPGPIKRYRCLRTPVVAVKTGEVHTSRRQLRWLLYPLSSTPCRSAFSLISVANHSRTASAVG